MATTFVSGITPQRHVALHHLRANPDNVKRVVGALEDAQGAMCAAGIMCHAVEIKMRNRVDGVDPDPATTLAMQLEMPTSHVSSIFTLNDSNGLSFAQIAAVLEDYFAQTGSSATIRTPVAIYEASASKYKLVK